MKYRFEIKDIDAGGRIGELKLGDKKLITPNIFPVVNPFSNLIPPRELYEHFGAQSLFTNAYIIYQNQAKNPTILEKGLHKHLDFPGIIATDSGGFQDYMYGGDIKITPEEIEPFQEKIGSDCPVILDIPVQTTDSYEEAQRKIQITLERAQQNVSRRSRSDTAWFGPIHGSIYPDLLKHSTVEMSKMDFGIYAIGGVVKTFIDYRFDLDVRILLEVKKWLRNDRPLHMFGLGLPAFFPLAVACGADTFDSAAYILYAKDDRYFTLTGTKSIHDLVELPCHCPVCTSYTAKELQKLPKKNRIEQIARHNLYHTFSELRTVRQAIKEGTLWELVEHRIHAHPKFVKAIKETQNYSSYFINHINFSKNKGQRYLCEASFNRPIFQHFRQKVQSFRFTPKKTQLVCLPELDQPGVNNSTVRGWLTKLRHSTDRTPTQIYILSNVLGFIPLELSEMYPASQHEGSGDMLDHQTQREFLLNLFSENLKINKETLQNINILIPKDFVNEYQEMEPFQSNRHIIHYLPAMLAKKYPQISVTIHTSIEDLHAELK